MMHLLNSALFAAVADAAIRGTVILLAALVATSRMRRASASARHLVWLAALTAILLLPIARGFVPEWRVLPVPSAPAAPSPTPSIDPPAVDVASPLTDAPIEAITPAPVATFRLPVDWMTLALLVWLAGAMVSLLRLAGGVIRLRWVERRAVEMTDDEWVRMTDGLARRLKLGRIVRLLREPGATVPMTWGVFRPVVLLPGEADGWRDERRRVVLAHELAHVRRWDAATQWIAHVALAVFWFNPLVWMAARKLREEREHACDDAVLEIGTRATDYADHLLDIVRSLGTTPGTTAALAMARKSQFEGRLLAILDNAVRRNGVSRTAGLAIAAAALVCLLPLAALRPAQAAPVDSESSNTSAAVDPRALTEPAPIPAGSTEQSAARKPLTAEASALEDQAAAVLLQTESTASELREAAAGLRAGTMAPVASAPPASPNPLAGESAGTLRDAAERGDPVLYAQIIQAAEGIASPTERRTVLMELLERPDLSADNVLAIIAATRTMDSQVEKRVVLSAVSAHAVFRRMPRIPAALLDVVERMESSVEQRNIILAVWAARRWDTASLVAAFRVAGRIASDVEMRYVLLGAVETQRVEGAAREAYVAATTQMDSDHERGVALRGLLGDAAATRTSRTAPASRTAASQTVEGTVRGTASAAPRRGESEWDSDISLDLSRNGKPREIRIHSRDVFFSTERGAFHRIGPGGSLTVEERFDGVTRRIRAVPGANGAPVFTYTVNGERRPSTDESRHWMAALIHEVTGG